MQAIIRNAPPGALRIASTAGQASHMHTSTNPTLLNVSEASQRWPSQSEGANRIDKPAPSKTSPKIKANHLGSGFCNWLISRLPVTEANAGWEQAVGLRQVSMSLDHHFDAEGYSHFDVSVQQTRRCSDQYR